MLNMNPRALAIFFLLVSPLVFAQTLHPSTSGVFANTSVSTTSSIFSDVSSFNFTNPIGTQVKCFGVTTILASASGGSGLVIEYEYLENGVLVGSTSRSLSNGESAVPFIETRPFNQIAYGTTNIALRHRHASGTGTATTVRTSSTVFCLTDLKTGIDLPDGNRTINTTFNNTAAARIANFSLTLDDARRVVVIGSERFTKTTTGNVFYYANITYSNGTSFTCPTISRYAVSGATASTGYSCITPSNAPAGLTDIGIWAWQSSGSTVVYGEFNAFGYSGSASLSDGSMTLLDGLSVSSTSSTSVANVSVEVVYNDSNVYALTTYSNNASVNGLAYTGALSVHNSTGQIPAMTDANLYPSTFVIATANQTRVTKQQRDFRNVTAGNYTVYYNLSVATGYTRLTGGALLALRTDSVPNTILPLSPSFVTPQNTTYFKSAGTLMLVEWSSARAAGGAAIDFYNVDMMNPDGSVNASLYGNSSENFVWNFSSAQYGSYYMRVIATDLLGYEAVGASLGFQVSETAPSPTPSVATFISVNQGVPGVDLWFFVLFLALAVVLLFLGFTRANLVFMAGGGLLFLLLGILLFYPVTTQVVSPGFQLANYTVIQPQVTSLVVSVNAPLSQAFALVFIIIGLYSVLSVTDNYRSKGE
jgi:hypothetical protein